MRPPRALARPKIGATRSAWVFQQTPRRFQKTNKRETEASRLFGTNLGENFIRSPPAGSLTDRRVVMFQQIRISSHEFNTLLRALGRFFIRFFSQF
jgi:hypothetical protein